MKNNLIDDDLTQDQLRRRPPLPADAKYRQQQQWGEIFENLDDEKSYYPGAPARVQNHNP